MLAIVFAGSVNGLAPSLLFNNDCRAQWVKVHDFGPGSPVRVVTFNKWGIGFAGVSMPDTGTTANVWRSSDSGQTWRPVKVTLSVAFAQRYWHPILPDDFTFKDSLTGWFTSIANSHLTYGGGGIYKTTDGGASWFSVYFDGWLQPRAIYYCSESKRLLSSLVNGGGIICSTDEGLNWIDAYYQPNYAYNGFASLADSIIVITTSLLGHGPLLRSTDGGLTWRASDFVECWQPYGNTSCNLLFAEIDGGYWNPSPFGFYRSADQGLTWQQTFGFNRTSGGNGVNGCIRGDASGNLYVQDVTDGFIASADSGSSWKNICGPGNFYDTRFCVFDHTIIAGDAVGGLWMLDMSKPAHILMDSGVAVKGADCEPVASTFHISSTFPCWGSVILDSVSLQDSQQFVFASSALLPRIIGEADSVIFNYIAVPGNVHPQHDTTVATLHFTVAGVRRDTTIVLTGARDSIVPTQAILTNVSGTRQLAIPVGHTDTAVIRLQNPVSALLGLVNISCTVPFDNGILSVNGPVVGMDGWQVTSEVVNGGLITLQLLRPTSDAIPAGAEVARILFASAISKDSVATIILSNVVFNDGLTYKGCTAFSAMADTLWVTVPSACGDLTLRSYMATGSPFQIESVEPNPAGSEVRVHFVSAPSGPVEVAVLDVLGRLQISREVSGTSATLDVSALPEGTYYLRLSSGGFVETRRVVVGR